MKKKTCFLSPNFLTAACSRNAILFYFAVLFCFNIVAFDYLKNTLKLFELIQICKKSVEFVKSAVVFNEVYGICKLNRQPHNICS